MGAVMLWLIVALGGSAASVQEKTVSLRATAKPLKLVAAEIAQQTRSTIIVDKEIAERKLVCLVDKAKEADLLSRIATVLGADCVRRTGADGVHFDLTPKPAVHSWLRFYDRSRTAAQKAAADRLANDIYARTTKSLREALNNGDPQKETAALKIARLMPEKAWRAMAQAKAEGIEGPVGRDLIVLGSKPAYLYPFSSLNPEAQETVRQVILALPQQARQYYSPESSLFITLSLDPHSSLQPFIGIAKPDKNGLVSGGYPSQLPFGLSASQSQRDTFQAEEMLRKLKPNPVPKDAVLGFTVAADNSCAEPVRIGADSLKAAPKIDNPSRVEVLTRMHESLRLNVVSDYYTDDTRLERVGATWESTLKDAALAFHCVFREESGYLLSRTTDFAERNYREAPYPLFEEAIAIRTKQAKELGDNTPQVTGIDFSAHPERDRSLPLRLLLDLCGLPHEQFIHLARYDDKKRFVRFRELRYLLSRFNASVPEYMVLGLVGRMSPPLESASGGVPFETISPALREIILTDVAIKGQLEQDPLTPGGMLHLRWLPFSYFVARYGEHAEKDQVGWYLQILWPGTADRPERIIFVRDIVLAQPPESKEPPAADKAPPTPD
jgi:hypothetical protein